MPRDQDVQGRRLDRFWKVLREDDQLADRSYNVLEQFLDTTEDALDGGLDERQDQARREVQAAVRDELEADRPWP